MSRPFRKRNALAVHEMHYGPNMTPMVDVVMVILIFFMSSTAILDPEWFLRSSLPRVNPNAVASDQQPQRVQIRILSTSSGSVFDMDEQKGLTLPSLQTALRKLVADRSPDTVVVLISPEPHTPYDDVVRVHELCERLGLKKVGLFETAEIAGRKGVELPTSESIK